MFALNETSVPAPLPRHPLHRCMACGEELMPLLASLKRSLLCLFRNVHDFPSRRPLRQGGRGRNSPTSCASAQTQPQFLQSQPERNMFATFLAQLQLELQLFFALLPPPSPLLSIHNRSFRRTFWSLGICFRVAVVVAVVVFSSALWCCAAAAAALQRFVAMGLFHFVVFPFGLARILETSYSWCLLPAAASCCCSQSRVHTVWESLAFWGHDSFEAFCLLLFLASFLKMFHFSVF